MSANNYLRWLDSYICMNAVAVEATAAAAASAITQAWIFMSFIGSMQLKSCNYTLFEAQLIWKTTVAAAAVTATAASSQQMKVKPKATCGKTKCKEKVEKKRRKLTATAATEVYKDNKRRRRKKQKINNLLKEKVNIKIYKQLPIDFICLKRKRRNNQTHTEFNFFLQYSMEHAA